MRPSQSALTHFFVRTSVAFLSCVDGLWCFRKVVQQSRSYFHDFRGEAPTTYILVLLYLYKKTSLSLFPCWTKKHLCVLSFFCCALLTLITTRAEVLWHSTKKKVNGKRICAHCGIQYINRLEIFNSSYIFAFELAVFWDRNTVIL